MPAEGYIEDIEAANRSIREIVEARHQSTDTRTEEIEITNTACRTVTDFYEIDGDDDGENYLDIGNAEPLPGAFGRFGSQEFLRILDEIKSLHIAKSQDYGSDKDPLANIRAGADLIGIDPWKACLIRIADKITRLKTFCAKGEVVFDGLDDTLKDLSAYAAIALVFYREQHRS
jgi:hypothetical protein